jgi:tetratricopeptide (TPR) repeat protein
LPIRARRQKPWQEFAILAWVSISGIFWLTFRGPAWQAVLIALVAIGFSVSAGRLPFRRTPFDLLFLLFSLTALVGVWTAYQRTAAWDKFWVLTLSLLIYYALASQPRQNGWLVSGLICLWGALVSLNFLFVNDFQALPADFRIITRLGQAWLAVRPALPGDAPAPNTTAGILAGFFPFTLALGLAAWRGRTTLKNPWLPLTGAVLSAGLLLLAIFMTSSRGAWIALASGLGFWLAWQVGEKLLQGQPGRRRLFLILGGCGVSLLVLGLLFALPGSLDRILTLTPGLPTGEIRLGIDRLTLPLIGDFPFTGGGLGAFTGLFSQYMLVIPHVMFTYGHNLYLDVALEQGLAGLALLLAVYLGSAFLLARSPGPEIEPPPGKLLRQAALTSLVITSLHGLVDDPLYGIRATPFLWVLPGIAAFSHPAARSIGDLLPVQLGSLSGGHAKRIGLVVASGLLLITVVAGWLYGPKRLAAVWMADWGAVLLSQVQLSDFPSNEWTASQDISQLAQAQAWLERAVRLDPSNRTANHRLGLIALQSRDYDAATDYLKVAHLQDASHRGVIKNLGYAYVWAGQYDQALPLLAQIPEAGQELGYYTRWWKGQGRADLAQNAARMIARLAGGTLLRSAPFYAMTTDRNSLIFIR